MKTDTTEKCIIFINGTQRWLLPLDEAGVSVPRVGENVHLPGKGVQARCYEVVRVDYFFREVPRDPWNYLAPLGVQVRVKKKDGDAP
ncbi:MAG: hypothetical protein ACLQU2_13335 [Candidatus Binataceae bacterium]